MQLKDLDEETQFNVGITCETAIIRVSESYWYPDLTVESSVIENAKNLTLAILDAKDALSLIEKIDYSFLDAETLSEIYYYLECSLYSQEIISFLGGQWIDVVFVDVPWMKAWVLLRMWDLFYSQVMWMVQLDKLKTPHTQRQKTEFYTWIVFQWKKVLLRIHHGMCEFEQYYWDPIKLWQKTFQIIKNKFWTYDIINTDSWILYNVACVGFEGTWTLTVRLFYNSQKTEFIDFDGNTFSPLVRLKKQPDMDLSWIDWDTEKPIKH